MYELALILLGAILGVVIDLLLRQPILRFILQIKRRIAKLTGRADPFAGKPYQLKFGDLVTDWISLHGTGELRLRSDHLRADLTEERVKLPVDLETLRNAAVKELDEKSKSHKCNVWNGQTFALTNFYPTRYGITEEPGICFEFSLTDYAARLGINRKLDVPGVVVDAAKNPTTIREKYFPRFDPDTPNRYLTHSFGINLLVITNDHQAILVQRSKHVGQKKGYFNISVNEGMQYPQDLDEFQRPSFLKTTVRGLWEELGIELSSLGMSGKDIEFLNFGALASVNEYALLGRVKLPLSVREIEEAYYGRSKDGSFETKSKLHPVDFLPDTIAQFVSNHTPWAHNALATLYYAMVRDWGYWEVKSALVRNLTDGSELLIES